MALEVTAEERVVVEMIIPGNLLDALRGCTQQELELHDDIMVDDRLRRAPSLCKRDIEQILGRDMEPGGIERDLPALFVMLHDHFHEARKEFVDAL